MEIEEALRRLLEGNRRYAAGQTSADWSARRRAAVAGDQRPFAMVLGCVDSRVPPELVFDQGLGDLLVIRTAAQALDQAVLGSLEFGALALKIPLLVVLGHRRCGAVQAAMDVLAGRQKAAGSIAYLVESLAPAVEQAARLGGDPWDQAGRANAAWQAEQVRRAPSLRPAVESGRLVVVGAWYDLDTGVVEILSSP